MTAKELKPKKKSKPGVTCTAYTVAKASPTNAQAYEVKIQDGVVVKVTEISRAPDMPASVIGRAIDKLWEVFRVQSAAYMNEACDEE